ncbi:pre-16S rRNA-processing nuclease YqgF [Candidatus Fermentibacterales bacterium]|nr:pre-16S rRNA-processing nuclease YqgF [Candidatus Fermentibacterales bacterium]
MGAGPAIGVDYGRVRTGFALCRDGVVVPLEPLPSGEWRLIAGRLEELREAHSASLIVLGLPLTPSGRETELSSEVRSLAGYLEKLGLRVELCRESGTTQEAEALSRQAGGPGRAGRLTDSLAAVVILKRHLDIP